jgi:aspartyl protease
MLDLGGRPVVELRINGKGPFPFLLDTGAGVTVVSEDLSRELSLSAPADMQMRAVAGSDGAPPPMVAIHEIRLGDAVIEGIVAMMMPSGALRVGGNAPRGVLAASAFWGYLLTYDYPGKRILIKKGSLAEADSKSIFQYNKDQLLPMIPVRIAGHDTQVDLDTGSPHGLTLPTRFLAELPLATQPKTVGKAHTPNGTEFTVSVARVDGTIELGRYKLETDEVHFSDIRPGPFPPNGNIGYQVLRHFVVTLDCKNRRIQLAQ